MQMAQGDALDFPGAGDNWSSRALPFAESLTSASATPGSPWIINCFVQRKTGGNKSTCIDFDYRLEATSRLKLPALLVPSQTSVSSVP